MSVEYYFKKWQRLLTRIEELVNIDRDYQTAKSHSKELCMTVQRLSGVLGGYIAAYNDAMDILQHIVQVQKIKYIADIVGAISQRIVELKHQLSQLESSNFQFVSRGIADFKLTTADAELKAIPEKVVRTPKIQEIIEDVMRRAQEAREKEEEESIVTEEEEPKDDPWFMEENKKDVFEVKQDSLDEEQRERRDMLNLIGAQEKCRQVVRQMKFKTQKRQMWEKHLDGSAKPDAPLHIRIRAACIIQRLARTYFEVKRQRIKDCMRDEKLGIRLCKKLKEDERIKNEEINQRHVEMQRKYEEERKENYKNVRLRFETYKTDEIKEDYREEIRDWFRKWYKEAWFFYDIPKENQGGSTLILLDEVPSPGKWLEENQLYMDRLKSNKGKSGEQLRNEKKAAKKEEQMLKKQEQMKAKLERKMLEKLMKNPKMHPGFHYPISKQTQTVLIALENYHTNWHYIDYYESEKAKENFIPEIEKLNATAEIKREIRPIVDVDMRVELKTLKEALKEEYETFEEEMPQAMLQTFPKIIKKTKPVQDTISNAIVEKMLELAIKGYLKEYPPTRFEDFKGEANFAGDDLRCNYVQAIPFGGETRSLWWEKCRELSQGFKKILLVGPKGSGKTVLVHCMATVNDAVLFELDPVEFNEDSAADLQELINSVAACAKAAQPAVIYLRHLHRLFYSKKPDYEPELNKEMLKKYLIKKLVKKFGKADKVTIIGTCIDPWLTRSSQLLKQFPSVFLMPNTTYTTTKQILTEWVLNNRFIPSDLDVSSLARVLQGYSFGYLKKALQDFLSAERIVRMAAYGLKPEEVFDFILQDQRETPVEYELYLKWYSEKTHWGNLEKKHLAEQIQFQDMVKKYAEKQNKNKMKSEASSLATLL